MSNKGWIGVDLDGTLAYYDQWRGEHHVGEPILPMLDRVKKWLSEGREVRIFTARVASAPGDRADVSPVMIAKSIQNWCELHGLPRLKVTNEKDFQMIELWDDRAVTVGRNTGEILSRPQE